MKYNFEMRFGSLAMMHFEIEPFTIENILLSLTSGKNINTSLYGLESHAMRNCVRHKKRKPVAFL